MRIWSFLALPIALSAVVVACGAGPTVTIPNALDGGADGTTGIGVLGGDAGANEAGSCQPKTCADLGYDCGVNADGCGGTIMCGSCTSPQFCGAGGFSKCGGNASVADGGNTGLCVPTTCAAVGYTCGQNADGCGNILDCGTCVSPAFCGGAGFSQCGGNAAVLDAGGNACVPATCASLGFNCGSAGDGCGNSLSCGTCSSPEFCGGGGFDMCGGNAVAADAGGTVCVPKTCASLGYTCGTNDDGCGNALNCGTCAPPQFCGGGGFSVCGGNTIAIDGGGSVCTPATCASLGFTCGSAGDGCGHALNCGTCTSPQFCGGAGFDKCGGNSIAVDSGGTVCVPKTCGQLGYNCGTNDDGCGNSINCGSCSSPQFCGGGGFSVCGGNTIARDAGGSICTPTTCAKLGYNCGPAGDGCGNTLSCGTCASPQFCGGGGFNVCGGNSIVADGGSICVPATCSSLKADCGSAGDGCGNVLQCGTCALPEFCGGGGASVCGLGFGDGGFTFSSCEGGVETMVSGTVVAGTDPTRGFGQPDPIYNALVYIAGSAVKPFSAGVTCGQCGSEVTGNPIVSAVTGPDGKFVLTNVPVGAQNLVIQLGRWRRQVPITVTGCKNNTQGKVRMPRNQTEGDIPLMAIATGNSDPIECVLRKMGIEDSEFTAPTGTGRVQVWADNGGTLANAGAASDLESSATNLDKYDIVLLPCVGGEVDKSSALQQNIVNYANSGGRVFTTHYSYVWHLNNNATATPAFTNPFFAEAPWFPDPNQNFNPSDPITATVDQSFQKGKDFATWLVNTTASGTNGQLALHATRHDVDSPPAGSALRYLYADTGTNHQTGAEHETALLHFTFDTPLPPAALQCGRVVFSDFHVNTGAPNGMLEGDTIPAPYCKTGAGNEIPLTPQERALEFMMFDLASCVSPPACQATTCAKLGAACGLQGDGCGGQLNCGTCTAGETCGGGGVANQCGSFDGGHCTPKTCNDQAIQCGPAGDGCGGLLQCGTCTSPQRCGGAGVAGVCGFVDGGSCTPKTCNQLGFNCGPAGDGCGGQLNCGACTAPDLCGGAGTPGVCGFVDGGSCTPETCTQQGILCGPAGDGCGNLLQCGNCTAPLQCGGSGQAGVCGLVDGGSCAPATCNQLGFNCGPAGDGCGGQLDCGVCTLPDQCGGAGVAGVCGFVDGGGCAPETCAQQNIQCGPAGDGCGNLLQCGMCTLPLQCGGGGQLGICGLADGGGCAPETCSQLGFNCGPAGDGCGGLVQCGTCPAGQSCGVGGQPGVCAPIDGGSCTPTTCQQLGFNCGSAGDGCGGLLMCGTCGGSQTCGGGGKPGVCGGGAS